MADKRKISEAASGWRIAIPLILAGLFGLVEAIIGNEKRGFPVRPSVESVVAVVGIQTPPTILQTYFEAQKKKNVVVICRGVKGQTTMREVIFNGRILGSEALSPAEFPHQDGITIDGERGKKPSIEAHIKNDPDCDVHPFDGGPLQGGAPRRPLYQKIGPLYQKIGELGAPPVS